MQLDLALQRAHLEHSPTLLAIYQLDPFRALPLEMSTSKLALDNMMASSASLQAATDSQQGVMPCRDCRQVTAGGGSVLADVHQAVIFVNALLQP